MSLQNILSENNETIYCKNLDVSDSFNVTNIIAQEGIFNSVSTNEILTDPGEDIVVYNNIVTVEDQGASLGTGGRGFNNLFCANLCGLGGPVNVQTSINGPVISGNPSNLIITSPVGITGPGVNPVRLNNGLVFGNVGSNNTTLSNYYTVAATPSTQGSVSGPFASISIVDWVATRIGNTVSLRFRFNRTNCSTVSAQLIIIFGSSFTSDFYPSTSISFPIRCATQTTPTGTFTNDSYLGTIDTNGQIRVTNWDQTPANINISWGNGSPVGLAIPDGHYFQLNYNI